MDNQSSVNLRDAKMVMRFLSFLALGGGLILLVGLFVHSRSGLTIATGLLWAAAAAAAGALAGFLFGIPRVLQSNGSGESRGDGDKSGGREDSSEGSESRYQVNTNLEQISDWLTKIIVGIGLVELRNVPGAIENLATYFGRSVPGENLEAIGGAIVIYFGILGFLLGYLATRLYLAGAFSRADRLMDVGGLAMTEEQVATQQGALLTDVIKTLSGVVRSVKTPGTRALDVEESFDATAAQTTRNILWVDDNPSNNGVLIKNLKDEGIRVDLAMTTEEAVEKLSRSSIDWVITDMGREEPGGFEPRAGLELLEELRSKSLDDIPVVVYTSRRQAHEVGDEARAAGAIAVTASPVELLGILGIG